MAPLHHPHISLRCLEEQGLARPCVSGAGALSGARKREKGHSWILSLCSSPAIWFVPALPCPPLQLLPPQHIPRRAAAAAPATAMPIAAIGSPETPFFKISAQSLQTWHGGNEHPQPSCGKTTDQPSLERKQGSEVLGEKLKGRGCISVALRGTTRER